MEVIAQSGIRPKRLAVYQRTPRCSVPIYDITTNLEMLDSANLKNAGKYIEQLALSISTKVVTGATERPPRVPVACHDVACYERTATIAYVCSLGGDHCLDDEKFDGLARFLKFTPNLKTLDIHFYSTLLKSRISYQLMFTIVANEIRLPLLRQCSLRGITTSEESLLQFLSNHPQITDLTLNQISLTPEGSWESIFAHISQKLPNLARLHLSTLKASNKKTINLHPVWEHHSKELEENSRSQVYYVHTKEFSAADIRKGLEFRPKPYAVVQGSPAARSWLISVKREYGAPWESK